MASISWKSVVSGGWTVGADWSSGTVPGSGDDATLGLAGAYTVTVTGAQSAASLAISDASAQLFLGAGSSLTIGGTASIAGDLELQSGGMVSLGGSLTVAAGGRLNLDTSGGSTGSQLSVAGDLTNSGVTTIGATTSNVSSNAGGGKITVTGTLVNSGTFNILDDTATATVVTASNLANTGTIVLDSASTGASELILTAGVAPSTLSATITLAALQTLTPAGPSLLEFASGQIGTIASTGKLVVGNASSFVADAADPTHNSALVGLTSIAGDFELQRGAALSLTGGLTVSGQLNLDTSGGSTGSQLSVAGDLTNSGVTTIGATTSNVSSNAGGGKITVTGTLVNSGTFNILDDIAAATVVTASNLANTGTLVLDSASTGASELIITAGVAPSTLSATITLAALQTLTPAGASLLEFASGQIGTIASTGKLVIGNASSFVADAADPTHNSALVGLTSITGDFELQRGAALSLTGGLTVSGQLNLDTSGGSTGSQLSVAGDLTNSGVTTIGATTSNVSSNAGGGKITVTGTLVNSGTFNILDDTATATVVTASNLANTGTIVLDSASTGASELILTAGVAPSTLSATITLAALQTLTPAGPSLLEFASGQIGTIASTGKLVVGNASSFVADAADPTHNSALVGLTSIAGDFELQRGAALSLTGGLTVSGQLNLDTSGGSTGSQLSVAGDLTNSGVTTIGATTSNVSSNAGGGKITVTGTLVNSGTFNILDDIAAATVVTASNLANTGTLVLDSASTGASELIITAGVAPSTLAATITLAALQTLTPAGPSLLEFASGQIGTIASTGKLVVGNASSFVADAADPTHNSALVGLTSIAGDFELQRGAALSLTGGLTVSGVTGIDSSGAGGSNLTIRGTLSNSGALQIGNTGITATTTMTASGLVNSGKITVNSKLGGVRATLNLLGSGTSLNTGSITSNTDAIAIGAARLVNGSTGSAAGLISGGYAGVVLSNDGALVNYGTVKGIQSGVSLEPPGSVAGTGVAVTNYGLFSGAVGIVDGDALGTADTVVNRGRISGTSGAGITLGGGADRVDNFGTISGANGTAVAFGSGRGTVVIEKGAVFGGVLGGLAAGDLIDFAGVSATGFTFAGGALTLLNKGTVVPGATVAVTGSFTGTDLALVSDGAGGVEIGIAPVGPVIVGTYYTPILLSNPSINNSATVTATGLVAPSYGDAIIGGAGVPGTVSNLGTITAASPSAVGISLSAGGLVANGALGFAGGYISGSLAGIKIGGGNAVITNLATITGGSGVLIAPGSSATVSNAGTIAGTSGSAVSLGGGTNRLILAPGASLAGKADGGGGKSVVEVVPSLTGVGAVGAAAAAVYVSLGSVTNFSALQIDPGAVTDAGGNLTFDTLVNQGQINLAAGDSMVIGTVAGAAGGGTIDLKSGGMVHFTGAVAAGQTVLFRPPGGTVAIDHPEQFAAAITQFAATDVIDLPLGQASFQQYAGGVLSLVYGGGTVALQLSTTAVTPQFLFTPDGGGGTDIFVSDACFCRGTLILTERGEVAVEDLRVGDRVRTLSGSLKPIVWIGFGCDLVTRRNSLARPIIVGQGALADGVPHRDLYLTHGHALYLDGVLIPVENLVNHRSIVWDETARVVEFFHIELEDHDVLLANGAPAESYYDANNRAQFHNARPGSMPGEAKPTFAAVLTGGPIVERVWTALFKRSGGWIACDTTDDPDLHLVVNRRRIEPAGVVEGSYSFALAGPPTGGLLICSRSGVPSLIGITAHDHRRLGVALARIVISQPGVATAIEANSAMLLDGGCHPAEGEYAWTDGELTLPRDLFAHLNGPFTVAVAIERPGMRYPLGAALADAA